MFVSKSKERKFPKFVSKEMENMYIEELKSSVNLLMANLESMPVSKGGSEFKLQKLRRSHNTSIIDMGEENENQLSKSDVVLSFSLEVSYMHTAVCRVHESKKHSSQLLLSSNLGNRPR